MDSLLDALAKITDDHKVMDALMELWPEGRVDLKYSVMDDGTGAKNSLAEWFRIEAWPRNSGKGKALGKRRHSKVKSLETRTIRSAWLEVLGDSRDQCKWSVKPCPSGCNLRNALEKDDPVLRQLSRAFSPIRKVIRAQAGRDAQITIRFRTPSVKRAWRDRFSAVRLTVSPVSIPGVKDRMVGQGTDTSGAAYNIKNEIKRLEGNAKGAQEREANQARVNAIRERQEKISNALRQAEPGDLIIQAEGEKPTLILTGDYSPTGHVEAWSLNPVRGFLIRFNYFSIQRTPRIVPMSPLARKLLLAYVAVREKLSDHVHVRRGQPGDTVGFRVGSREFGFYLRRDFRDFRGVLTFLG